MNDSVTPIQRLNPPKQRVSVFKRYLYRWQRCRSRDWISYYEWQMKVNEEKAAQERATYQFWKDREREIGIQDYDDRDVTRKYETYLYGGSTVLFLAWVTFFVVMKG